MILEIAPPALVLAFIIVFLLGIVVGMRLNKPEGK